MTYKIAFRHGHSSKYHDRIPEMACDGAGVRDTSRTLKWASTRHPNVKKRAPRRITPSPVAHADIALICEFDEQ
ncbi:hypothetical protein GT752_00025 [Edwardsiella piscicida]|nr:hypothetical protein GT752_00025 [Edwardsiella piscicida]